MYWQSVLDVIYYKGCFFSEANKTQYFCSLKTEQKQPECLFIWSWKTCFSNLVRRNFEAKCFSYFMESLILAQDERWRRA